MSSYQQSPFNESTNMSDTERLAKRRDARLPPDPPQPEISLIRQLNDAYAAYDQNPSEETKDEITVRRRAYLEWLRDNRRRAHPEPPTREIKLVSSLRLDPASGAIKTGHRQEQYRKEETQALLEDVLRRLRESM